MEEWTAPARPLSLVMAMYSSLPFSLSPTWRKDILTEPSYYNEIVVRTRDADLDQVRFKVSGYTRTILIFSRPIEHSCGFDMFVEGRGGGRSQRTAALKTTYLDMLVEGLSSCSQRTGRLEITLSPGKLGGWHLQQSNKFSIKLIFKVQLCLRQCCGTRAAAKGRHWILLYQ